MPEENKINFCRCHCVPAPLKASVATSFDIPHAGTIENIIILIAIVTPATAWLPNSEINLIIKIHEVIATIICTMPPSEVFKIALIFCQCKCSCERITFMCLTPLNKNQTCVSTPIPLPIFVATAAPSIPN